MHMLHKILVRLDEDLEKTLIDREELMVRARSEAEYATESYCDAVYDWRETDTAGRWAEEYPENVLLAAENVDRFVEEILEVKSYQENMMKDCLERIGKQSTDLYGIYEKYKAQEPPLLISYDLRLFVSLLCGHYEFDSGFWDADIYSSKVTQETIDQIRESPGKWALVMFDYHI